MLGVDHVQFKDKCPRRGETESHRDREQKPGSGGALYSRIALFASNNRNLLLLLWKPRVCPVCRP